MAQFRFTSASSVLTTGANEHAFNTDSAGPDSLIVEANAALQAEGAGADAVRLGANGAFTPRTIAAARTQRAQNAGRRLRIAIRRLIRMVRDLRARLARRWREARDLRVLIFAEDRQLADIGLTRCDLSGPPRTLAAAGRRREEAMALARARSMGLPRADSPSLMPAAPEPYEVLDQPDRIGRSTIPLPTRR